MKNNEHEVLSLLRQNARMPIDEIAKSLDITKKAAETAIQSLEKKGVIIKYATIINEEKLHKQSKIRALIQVSIRPEKNKGYDAIARRICQYPNVLDHYLVSSGQFDYLIIVEGDSMQDISDFVANKLASLDNVRSTATHFILKKYKEKGIVIEEKASEKRLVYSP